MMMRKSCLKYPARVGQVAVGFVALLLSLSFADSAHAQETGLNFYGAQLEEFEYRYGDEQQRLLTWDGDVFRGNDKRRWRWLSEGEYDLQAGEFAELENRFVVQKPISEFFDVKLGLRLDSPKEFTRWYGVLGLTGLAPQWFEVDLDLFVSENGAASLRADVEYELLLTNRWILVAALESTYAATQDREANVGAGLNDVQLGLRLSYDWLGRKVAPYFGVFHESKHGETAKLLAEQGEAADSWFYVLGVRLML